MVSAQVRVVSCLNILFSGSSSTRPALQFFNGGIEGGGGGGEGGGGKKQSGRHHPPTLKSSLRASRICYSFFQGGLGKKVMRYQSYGGGGGGLGQKN